MPDLIIYGLFSCTFLCQYFMSRQIQRKKDESKVLFELAKTLNKRVDLISESHHESHIAQQEINKIFGNMHENQSSKIELFKKEMENDKNNQRNRS